MKKKGKLGGNPPIFRNGEEVRFKKDLTWSKLFTNGLPEDSEVIWKIIKSRRRYDGIMVYGLKFHSYKDHNEFKPITQYMVDRMMAENHMIEEYNIELIFNFDKVLANLDKLENKLIKDETRREGNC